MDQPSAKLESRAEIDQLITALTDCVLAARPGQLRGDHAARVSLVLKAVERKVRADKRRAEKDKREAAKKLLPE